MSERKKLNFSLLKILSEPTLHFSIRAEQKFKSVHFPGLLFQFKCSHFSNLLEWNIGYNECSRTWYILIISEMFESFWIRIIAWNKKCSLYWNDVTDDKKFYWYQYIFTPFLPLAVWHAEYYYIWELRRLYLSLTYYLRCCFIMNNIGKLRIIITALFFMKRIFQSF